jgi:hypothetical protein
MKLTTHLQLVPKSREHPLPIHLHGVVLSYSSTDSVTSLKSRMGWAVDVVRMDQNRNAHKVLVRHAEGNGPIGRPRHG